MYKYIVYFFINKFEKNLIIIIFNLINKIKLIYINIYINKI